jgi:protein involved in sex pheromone biosynthesis
MMNKKQVLGLMATSLFLTGCVGLDNLSSQSSGDQKTSENTVTVQSTTNQLSNDYYRALIIDGKYQPSQSRGVSLSLNSGFNMRNFETGLIGLSRNIFPTSQYFFQEGQILNTATINSWINRTSDTNPEGLNPAATGDAAGAGRTPYYLAQILEQDYMIQTENNFELGGISIGLAMNSVDYYTANDVNLHQEISDETLQEQGKAMANTILTRLRQNDALKSVPIVFGIFKQTSEDDIGGGTYVLEATSIEGTQVSEWIPRNNKIVVLPLLEGDPTEESIAFENFRSEVQNFFPNLSGVTARVNYSDNVAKKMVVSVMTQFYGESEIIALTQHVTDVANKYLPKAVPVEVRISSINGMEAFLMQDMEKGVFTYHVFD